MTKFSPVERKIFLELLKQIRINLGLRQADVAKLLNVPQSMVSKYEQGERRIDILELRVICRAFGLSLTEFTAKLEALIDNSRDETK